MSLFDFSVGSIVVIIVLILLLVLAVTYIVKNHDGFNFSEKESSNCYEDSYRPLSDGVIILNSAARFIYINPAAEKMLGYKLRSMMGRNYEDAFTFKHLVTGGRVPNVLGSSVEKTFECMLVTVMKRSFAVSVKYSPICKYEDDQDRMSYLLVLKDITEIRAEKSKMSLLENYDNLTQMRIPKSFETGVRLLIDDSHKYNSQHVLVYFSIDQFQDLKDAIGYAGTDNLIKTMAEVIKRYVKKKIDIIGRIGGNEFAVVFRDHNLPAAIRVSEAILKAVENSNFTSLGQVYPTTMSAGFVMVNESTTSSARAISEAAIACNVARKQGGNKLYAYKADNSEIKKLEGNLEWIVILKKAMEEDLFQMYAQPIHRLEPEEYEKPYSHYELLIRLFDKAGKPIAPYEFLSAAEYYSMMPSIDRWVVDNSLRQISKMPKQKPLPVFAINLHGQSLNDQCFLNYVVKAVEDSKVNPKMLCFEITEQVAVEDVSLVNQFISSLKMLGSTFSLDDFGTGVSSYAYLRSLDVDYLKIDGSFVKNIDTDEVSRTMVESICQVGHTMNLKVIAEYVEDETILKILREMGVDYGQGYHIHKPAPLNEVARHHMIN